MKESVCCVCDELFTDPSETIRRDVQRLPLVAWRVLLHHVHSDNIWRCPPGNLQALHNMYNISQRVMNNVFHGLYLSPSGVEEGEGFSLLCLFSLPQFSPTISKKYRRIFYFSPFLPIINKSNNK